MSFVKYETLLEFDNCLKLIEMVFIPGGILNIIIYNDNNRTFLAFEDIDDIYIFDSKTLTEYPDDISNEDLEDLKILEPIMSIEEANKIINVLVENQFIQHINQTEYTITKSLRFKLI
jgi:hypothetical protein